LVRHGVCEAWGLSPPPPVMMPPRAAEHTTSPCDSHATGSGIPVPAPMSYAALHSGAARSESWVAPIVVMYGELAGHSGCETAQADASATSGDRNLGDRNLGLMRGSAELGCPMEARCARPYLILPASRPHRRHRKRRRLRRRELRASQTQDRSYARTRPHLARVWHVA
jgi:hypothetical protein